MAPPPFAPGARPGGFGPGRLRAVLGLALAGVVLTLIVYLRTPPLVLDADAWRAVDQMTAALRELGAMRRELGVPVQPELDPALSGLIGVDYSDLTTTLGDLHAKQTSLNPRFAGLLVMWLKQAGAGAGDPVAVSLTGSFPALDLATLCACDALGLRPRIISSVGASAYGANIPGFTWLDMEARLCAKGFVRSRTRYASLGGIMDTGGGLDGTGIAVGEAAIVRHGATYLREGTPRSVVPDLERRLRLYLAGGRPKAFINVGGNVTSLGWVSEAALLDNGLLARVPSCSSAQRGIIFRMFEAGVPVIHLLNIERLAAANHLPIAPPTLAPASGPDQDLAAARRGHLGRLGGLLAGWLGLSAMLLAGERVLRRREAARGNARA